MHCSPQPAPLYSLGPFLPLCDAGAQVLFEGWEDHPLCHPCLVPRPGKGTGTWRIAVPLQRLMFLYKRLGKIHLHSLGKWLKCYLGKLLCLAEREIKCIVQFTRFKKKMYDLIRWKRCVLNCYLPGAVSKVGLCHDVVLRSDFLVEHNVSEDSLHTYNLYETNHQGERYLTEKTLTVSSPCKLYIEIWRTWSEN